MNLDYFLKVEKKYDLLNKEVDGYAFWVYTRAEIAQRYERVISHLQNAHVQGPVINTKRNIRNVKDTINTLIHCKMPKKHKDLLILCHPRRVLLEGCYVCPYTGQLTDFFTNSVVLESSYNNMHFKPVKMQNFMYADVIEYKAKLYCAFIKRCRPHKFSIIKQSIFNIIKEPIDQLNRHYNVSIDINSLINSFIYGYLIYVVTKKNYFKLLKRISPKAIIEVVSYCTECMTMNEVAYEMQIPTIELQHGVIDNAHLAYNYPRGYKIKQFPQYLFLFSEHWVRDCKLPISNTHVRSIGYPYLEKQVSKYKCSNNADNDKKNILFLSSGPVGDKLTKIAKELSEELDFEKFHIIYKLHPGEVAGWRERYPDLIDTHIEVIDSSTINLYELYGKSSIQVSAYSSTTVFEGLSFNLTTYILNFQPSKDMVELCENGGATLFDTTEELANMILGPKENKKSTKIQYWEANAFENMVREIGKYVS